MPAWNYEVVEYEAPGALRSAKLQELLNERGASGWQVVYMGDPEPYTANRTRHERRMIVFMKAQTEPPLLLEEVGDGSEHEGWSP